MFSNETKIAMLTYRKNLLMARDPMMNVNLIRKIDRKLRALGV